MGSIEVGIGVTPGIEVGATVGAAPKQVQQEQTTKLQSARRIAELLLAASHHDISPSRPVL